MIFGASAVLRLFAQSLIVVARIVESVADLAEAVGDPAINTPGVICCGFLLFRGRFQEAAVVFVAFAAYEVLSRADYRASGGFEFKLGA